MTQSMTQDKRSNRGVYIILGFLLFWALFNQYLPLPPEVREYIRAIVR
jgi:hypothetical protein